MTKTRRHYETRSFHGTIITHTVLVLDAQSASLTEPLMGVLCHDVKITDADPVSDCQPSGMPLCPWCAARDPRFAAQAAAAGLVG